LCCLRNQRYHEAVVIVNTAVETCRLEWIFSIIFFAIIIHTIGRALSSDIPTANIKCGNLSGSLNDGKQSNNVVSEKSDQAVNDSASNTQKMVGCFRFPLFVFIHFVSELY
jgi:hypothetical protein